MTWLKWWPYFSLFPVVNNDFNKISFECGSSVGLLLWKCRLTISVSSWIYGFISIVVNMAFFRVVIWRLCRYKRCDNQNMIFWRIFYAIRNMNSKLSTEQSSTLTSLNHNKRSSRGQKNRALNGKYPAGMTCTGMKPSNQ